MKRLRQNREVLVSSRRRGQKASMKCNHASFCDGHDSDWVTMTMAVMARVAVALAIPKGKKSIFRKFEQYI